VLRLEVADVLPQLLGQVALGLPLLDVGAGDAGDVLLVEDGGHRPDALQEVGDRLQIAVLEHAGLFCRGVGVIRDRVPCAEDEIREIGERNEIPDQRRAVLGALAEADGRHLGQGADRLRAAAAHSLHAGDESSGDGAETRRQDAETARGQPGRCMVVRERTRH
jgi:hypothetical protein